MRSLRYVGGGGVAIEEIPIPEPAEDEVLVRVEVSAVCGSERGPLLDGAVRNAGHEAAGFVERAPAGCGFQAGDRVGISAVRGCGRCSECDSGVEVRCGTPRVQTGMHAELVAAAPSTLRRLPPEMDAVTGVLASGDGLGVPVRGVRRAPHQAGERVLVLGLGPVGLAHVLVRSFLGADVVAVEPSAARRALGPRYGATHVFEPGDDIPGPPPALVVEASGQAESVAIALSTVAKGGTVLQSGECRRADVSPSLLISREITYVGSWYYATEDYDEILRLVSDGLDAASLVTHDVAAARAGEAYEAMRMGVSGKAVLRWSDPGPAHLSASLLIS